jgi:hypothetical protein
MAEQDTRFGGMMEVASSPTAKKEFHKEFKAYQDRKRDDDKGGGDTGGGLVSPPVIETKEPIIRKKEKPTRFHKRKLEKKIAPVKEPVYSLLSFPQQDTFGVLNNESFQEKTNRIIDAYVPQSFQNTLGVSYTLASAAITGDINLEKQITDKSSLSFKVDNWGNDVALIFNLQLGG